MCNSYGSPWSPPIYVVLSIAMFFSGVGTLLIIIALSTNSWEEITWDSERLRAHEGVNDTLTYINNDNGFYIVVNESSSSGNVTYVTSYLRNMHGGIWHICDTLTENFRETNRYKNAENNAGFLRYDCFNYITEYNERKADGFLDHKAVSLVRMQNSASSCSIVCLLSLTTAAMLGFMGVWRLQVSVVTVTGVLYIVAATFICFTLTIMMTKVGYYHDAKQCYSIDTVDNKNLCQYRTAKTSWSIPIAWVALTFLVISFSFWLLLSRSIRLEKIKAAML